MQSAADKEPSSTMLYVSNLPFSFEDKDLQAIFKGFEVSSAYVAVRRNGRSKGFGFVTFSSPEQQTKALAAFDGKELDGRPLTVKVAHKDDRRDSKGELKDEFKTQEPRQRRNKEGGDKAAPAEKTPSETVLYVSNLPFEFSDEDLKGVFAKYNPVSARIARRSNERSKGFGFVELASNADQKAALALDEHEIGERKINVKVSMVGADRSDAKPAGEKKKKAAPKKAAAPKKEREGPNGPALYVSNLPFDLTDDMLADLFKSKGHTPVSARIARRRDERSKGFGFVEFKTEEEQQAALKAVDQTNLVDRVISAKIALKDSGNRAAAGEGGNDNNAQGEGGAKRRRNRKRGNGEGEERKPVEKKEKKDSERLVYVSNLSFDVDDNELAKLFDGLTIKSAHVAVRHNGKSKGFGFVEFASHDEQKKALAKNGTELSGRTLVVEVAKEEVEPKAE